MIYKFKVINICYLMYEETFKINTLKYINLTQLICTQIRMISSLKIIVHLERLVYPDMLLMVEKGIRWGVCHTIHQYAKANNNDIKNYGKYEESSYLKYWDANNLFGC